MISPTAYVQKAIAYYEANGLDATIAQYRDVDSIENDRPLTLIDEDKGVLLVYHTIRSLEGSVRRAGLEVFWLPDADCRRHRGRKLGRGPGRQPYHETGRAAADAYRSTRPDWFSSRLTPYCVKTLRIQPKSMCRRQSTATKGTVWKPQSSTTTVRRALTVSSTCS